MPPLPSFAAVVIIAFAAGLLAAAEPTKPTAPKLVFKSGFAERDITPAIGMEAPGGYGKSYHRSFHDTCKVRAAVFDDGKQRVAIVGIDILFITRALTKEVRAEIEKQCGIKADHILLGASHSHSSGPIGMAEPGDYDQASPLVQDLYTNKSTIENPGFTQHLKKQLIEAVVAANGARVEAKAAVGYGHEDKVSFNRRLRMKNGLSFSHPGVGNPEIMSYAGPIDPQVGVIGVWDLKSNLIGVVVNFSCHATTSPGGISASWISAMEQTLRGATGQAALPVVFMQGASGDVTQVDNLTKFQNPASEEWWSIVGGRVGAEAFKTLLLIRRGASADFPIDVRQKVWLSPRRLPTAEKVKQAMTLVQQDPKVVGATEWTFAKEIVMLAAIAQARPQVEVEVQAIQIGPVVLVTNPAEYFVQYGLDIKRGSHFPFTFPVELANGCVGYVPTEEALGPNGGGYETRLTAYSNLEVSAGRKMADAGIALANSLTPGPVPLPASAPPFKAAWAYGNLPPELK
ncbi:MAG: hypothetical protein RL077_5316 [Verrucomicrobiota bacterium]